MFQIAEYHDEGSSLTGEKETHDSKLSWRGLTGEAQEPSSRESEQRRRIGSDPPFPESETLDDVGAFRGRSQSAPPNLWAAQRYGRELRRMSDEFHITLQKLPRPQSAGTASQMHRAAGWKEALQSWWRRGPPSHGPSRSPP